MGFHVFDWIVIMGIILLIFGPKGLQSIARNAGKTVGHAKEAKDKLLAELPMEELNSVRENISRIPMSPQQAAMMLLTPEQQRDQDKQKQEPPQPPEEKTDTPVQESSSSAS